MTFLLHFDGFAVARLFLCLCGIHKPQFFGGVSSAVRLRSPSPIRCGCGRGMGAGAEAGERLNRSTALNIDGAVVLSPFRLAVVPCSDSPSLFGLFAVVLFGFGRCSSVPILFGCSRCFRCPCMPFYFTLQNTRTINTRARDTLILFFFYLSEGVRRLRGLDFGLEWALGLFSVSFPVWRAARVMEELRAFSVRG